MLNSLIGFAAAEWFGVTWDYLTAGVLIAVGVYLAFFLKATVSATNPAAWLLTPLLNMARYVGYVLIVIGIFRGAVAYGKSVGASECEAAWKAQNLQAQIDKLKLENGALKSASETASRLQADLSLSLLTTQRTLDHDEALSRNQPACRRATADDDRRLRALVGNGSKRPRR